MKTPLIEPYLFFGGRCDEALAFYQQAIGARIDFVMRFNESPDPVPEGMIEPGFENKVMHASLLIGDQRIMASDGSGDTKGFSGFSLSLSVADEATAQQAFTALADGGTINLPIGPTFWSPCYGMLTDRFGVDWMVSVPGPGKS